MAKIETGGFLISRAAERRLKVAGRFNARGLATPDVAAAERLLNGMHGGFNRRSAAKKRGILRARFAKVGLASPKADIPGLYEWLLKQTR